MKRSSSQHCRASNSPDKCDERAAKKPKTSTIERATKVMELLKKHIDEHEKSRVDAQERIDEVCRAIREAVDEMEERLRSTNEEWYTKEETRLQESLVKLYTLGEENTDEEIKYMIKAVCEVVEHIRSMSPVWHDLQEGRRQYVIQ